MQDEMLLEQRVRFGELFDLYSSLLTGKQRMVCDMLIRADLSVAELGAELGMTRQGAYDLLKRSRDHLEEIERELGLREMREKYGALSQLLRENISYFPQELRETVSGLLAAEEETADV